MRRMGLVLLVVSTGLCGAKKSKKKRGPKGNPAAAAAVVTPDFPRAVDAAVVEQGVPLDGNAVSMDLEALARSRTTFKVNLDAAYLADLPAEAPDAVLKTLAAHPDWRVHEGPWGIRAALRDASGSVSPSGYHREGNTGWGAFIRVDEHAEGSPWLDPQIVAEVSATASTVTMTGLQVGRGPFKGGWSSAFRVEGDGIAFDVHSVGTVEDRSHTAHAVSAIARSLDIAVTNADLVAEQGVRGMYLPGGEPASAARFSMSSPMAGRLEVRARVSPPAWGWTWVRILKGGEAWEREAMAEGTREMAGAGEGGFYYLQGQVDVPEGDAFEGTAEIWFAPSEGAKPVLLASTPVTVPAR